MLQMLDSNKNFRQVTSRGFGPIFYLLLYLMLPVGLSVSNEALHRHNTVGTLALAHRHSDVFET